MFGILLFRSIIFNLGEECRRKILRNIFEIQDVSISDIGVREDRIIFRIFSDDVFYQYIFILGDKNNSKFVSISSSKRIFNCLIFIEGYSDLNTRDYFEILIQIFQCQDEYQVYQLVKLLL